MLDELKGVDCSIWAVLKINPWDMSVDVECYFNSEYGAASYCLKKNALPQETGEDVWEYQKVL